jgi:hypothetical protein
LRRAGGSFFFYFSWDLFGWSCCEFDFLGRNLYSSSFFYPFFYYFFGLLPLLDIYFYLRRVFFVFYLLEYKELDLTTCFGATITAVRSPLLYRGDLITAHPGGGAKSFKKRIWAIFFLFFYFFIFFFFVPGSVFFFICTQRSKQLQHYPCTFRPRGKETKEGNKKKTFMSCHVCRHVKPNQTLVSGNDHGIKKKKTTVVEIPPI